MPDEGALRTIAVATDFSHNAMPAFAWALELAQRHHSELVLVHALLPESAPAPDFAPMPEHYYRSVRDEARAKLEALMAEVRPAGLSISLELVVGSTAAGVVAAAERRSADVIVVGTRGRSGWRRLVVGSTAAQLVRDAPLPVLSVHPGHRGRGEVTRTVLVPTDFSAGAARATESALRMLPPAQAARLVLLHAHRPDERSARDAAAAVRAARDDLQARAYACDRPNVVVDAEIAPGAPAPTIAERAARIGADLVAMATRGRPALERLWIGSTAERVIAAAPCPVLTVRAPRH